LVEGRRAWSKRRGKSLSNEKRKFWPRRRGESLVEEKRESLAREKRREFGQGEEEGGERFTEDEAVTLWLRRSRDEMPYLTGRPCGVGR
jgi:hypothetical protein